MQVMSQSINIAQHMELMLDIMALKKSSAYFANMIAGNKYPHSVSVCT
jgi:hypothetical protein